eukprot:COSAG01_NODE_45794_length_406_cov_0.794788_2_plen_49_part_01
MRWVIFVSCVEALALPEPGWGWLDDRLAIERDERVGQLEAEEVVITMLP